MPAQNRDHEQLSLAMLLFRVLADAIVNRVLIAISEKKIQLILIRLLFMNMRETPWDLL